jgi:hypothetical protein
VYGAGGSNLGGCSLFSLQFGTTVLDIELLHCHKLRHTLKGMELRAAFVLLSYCGISSGVSSLVGGEGWTDGMSGFW